MIQHLTAKQVALTGLEKFDELGANNGHSACLYTYPDGRHCLIGACLSADLLEKITDSGSDGDSFDDVVKAFSDDVVIDEANLAIVDALQSAHDTLAHNNNDGNSPSYWSMVTDAARLPEPLRVFISALLDEPVTRDSFHAFLVIAAGIEPGMALIDDPEPF